MTPHIKMKHKTRKDRRKSLTGAKSVDNSCKNNGACPYCESNRTVKNKRREDNIKDSLKSHEDEN
jgi:hypothetical protein